MSTEAARDPVAVTIELAPVLFDAIDDVAREVTRNTLERLVREFGLERTVNLALEVSEQSDGQGIRVSVNGRECRFARLDAWQAAAYVSGSTLIEPLNTAESLLHRLQATGEPVGARVGEFIGLICRAAIMVQAGVLAPDHPLAAALNLGVPVPERSGGAVDAEVLEEHLAGAADSTVGVLVDPSYFRYITETEPEVAEKFVFLREGLFVELGLTFADMHFEADDSVRPRGFALEINDVASQPLIGLEPGTVLVNDTAERLRLINVDGKDTINLSTRQPCAIVSSEHQDMLEGAGLTTWDPLGYLVLCMATTLRARAAVLSMRDLDRHLLTPLARAFPAVVEAARAYAPQTVLAPVLRDLLTDGISIRDLSRVTGLVVRHAVGDAEERAVDLLTFVRWGLADYTSNKFSRDTGTLVVYLLGPALEAAVAESSPDSGSDWPHSPVALRVTAALRREMAHLPPTAQIPVILTKDELRRAVRSAFRPEVAITVLGYGDVAPDVNVQHVARIELS